MTTVSCCSWLKRRVVAISRSAQGQCRLEILAYRARKHHGRLEHETNVAAECLDGVVGKGSGAIHNGATHRIVQAMQQPEQRGLARPGWFDECGDGAVWNGQLDAIKDRHSILHWSHTLEGERGRQTPGQRWCSVCLIGRLST